MKALITGASGFVGHYLRNELVSHGYQVIGTDRVPESDVVLDLSLIHI